MQVGDALPLRDTVRVLEGSALSVDDIPSRLEEAWRSIDRQAEAQKDSHSAVFALRSFYRWLTNDERPAADGVLIEWAQSDDIKKQFDALALIDELSIVSALPVLRRVAEEIENSVEPSAPYDWAKVNRMIGRLSDQSVRQDGG